MAQRPILHFPDPRLRKVASAVTLFDPVLAQLAQDMIETMYAEQGIGLAGPQVNESKRIIVIDLSEEKNAPMVLINPTIDSKEGSQVYNEGCLSVPAFYEEITRAETIAISYQDIHGEKHSLQADGLLSVCIQHEIDHLDGKLFVDYLSSFKRQRIRKKLEKLQRRQ